MRLGLKHCTPGSSKRTISPQSSRFRRHLDGYEANLRKVFTSRKASSTARGGEVFCAANGASPTIEGY